MTTDTAPDVRYSLVISADLDSRLEALAQGRSMSKADILRRGLALYEVAVGAQATGNRFGIVDPDGRLTTEIVGL